MIECPFCGEVFEEDELLFEFRWGEVAEYYYNRGRLPMEPKSEYRDRSFYVKMKYDWRGNAEMESCSTAVNPARHAGSDPMCTESNGWPKVMQLLGRRRVFEVTCDDHNRSLPTGARILPLARDSKKSGGHTGAEGVSTGMFCPICEQQLNPRVLQADQEVRILLCGRRGSGKTVYVTQAISELMQGRLAEKFTIEAANQAVFQHYQANKARLKAFAGTFVTANNPGVQQDPYVYLLSNGKSTIRLIIQDIAGEDVENRTKYSKMVRKADMLLFFIDPWHIEEVRAFHMKNAGPGDVIVNRSTNGLFMDLNGVFQQMMNVVDRKFAAEKGQLAGMMLVKGDYLPIPMLSEREDLPQCGMMRQPVTFDNSAQMEFDIGMRSGFVRQCLFEWESTRGFARDVESKYPAHNTRYFVVSSLGHGTAPLSAGGYGSGAPSPMDEDDPDAQFNIGGSFGADSAPDGAWNYDGQELQEPARPEHVIDSIFWCLKRKGIEF